MTSPFSKPSEFSGGSYFKPADHMNDLAILLEPKHVDKNVRSEYQGNVRERDEVTTDITIFANSEALDKGVPTTVMKNCKIVHGMLSSTVERIIGGAMVARLDKAQTKGGSGYVFRDVKPEVETQVGTYFQKRGEEVEKNLADAPDFD